MTRLVVVVGFIVAFLAGLLIGIESRCSSPPPTTQPGHRGGWLTSELNLTDEQQEQMKQIWSETARRGGRERQDRRRQLARERDEAIAALVQPGDKDRYDEILKKYSDQTNALEKEWRESYQAAVERTKQILTPEQQTKYEEMLKRHQGERGPRDRHRGERERTTDRRGDRGPTSRGE